MRSRAGRVRRGWPLCSRTSSIDGRTTPTSHRRAREEVAAKRPLWRPPGPDPATKRLLFRVVARAAIFERQTPEDDEIEPSGRSTGSAASPPSGRAATRNRMTQIYVALERTRERGDRRPTATRSVLESFRSRSAVEKQKGDDDPRRLSEPCPRVAMTAGSPHLRHRLARRRSRHLCDVATEERL